MREVIYKDHKSSANTIYCTTSASDRTWILEQIQMILDFDDKVKGTSLSAGVNNLNKNLPRQGTGQLNSIRTGAQGIVDNMVRGSQRHFSSKTRMLVEKLLHEMNQVTEGLWDEIKWVEEGSVVMSSVETSGTTFMDLFEVTITVRAKG